tara:strand:+ start:170 stop:1069 length:900 start_codon:yes stop_codon:yes gene_type:complete
MRSSLFLVIVAFSFFCSCSKENFKAEIPSYLKIKAIDLETDNFDGSDSQKITDAWVTMDGIFLGAFEIPCTIPILAEGEHEFAISAGIKANGISATRIRYPFYSICNLFYNNATEQILEGKVNLYRDSTVTVSATTTYTDNTNFLFIESFEDPGIIVEPSTESDTTLQKTNIDSLVFEGYGSGLVELDSVNDFFELINSEFVTLNSIYNDNMLELNYKSDHSFKVGIAVKSTETGEINRFEALHIDSSSVWNKIYVHMTNQVNLGTTSDEFGVFIGMKKRANVETATFYFDNIKWLHKE